MTSPIGQAGAPPQKQPKFAPLFIDRAFTGLYTQRSVLHDPSTVIETKYYGGRPDALWDGSNIELTNKLTLARRPGLSRFSEATYPTPPDKINEFQLSDGTIQILVDCGSTPLLALTSCGNASGGVTVYAGNVIGGNNNAYVGMEFTVALFDIGANNGFFLCTASTATTLTLANTLGQSDTIAATAISSGAIWRDNQDGTKTLISAKGAGAGQAYFSPIADVCYIGDGVDQIKYTPNNRNGIVWNWGIATPLAQPGVVITPSASSAIQWVASTVFSTMGFIVDPNGNVQQLYSVNALGTNSTQLGSTGNGSPAFNNAYKATTNDGSVVWTCQGQITLWKGETEYAFGDPIYDPGTNCIFIQSKNIGMFKSGTTRPNFNKILGFVDNGINGPFVADGQGKWQNIGPVGILPTAVETWTKNTAFNVYADNPRPNRYNSAIAYPLVPFVGSDGKLCNDQPTYLFGATTAGTTANSNYTPWTGIPSQTPGQITNDNQLLWICQGESAWQASAGYTAWQFGAATFSVVFDGTNMQVCEVGGQSEVLSPGTSDVLSAAANASGGNTMYTGTFAIPFPAGPSTTITGFTTPANNGEFTVVSCNATQLVVANPNGAAEAHAGTAVFNPWGTAYGSSIKDNSVTWVCVGPPVTWAVAQQWYLPAVGFVPPQSSQPYGGAAVIGSGFVQFVTSSGLSQTPGPPAWSTTVGNTTTDNGVTWITVAPATSQATVWTKGHVYAYSYKCRAVDDFYSPVPLGGGNTPPGVVGAMGAPTGGETGAISSASPVFTITGANTGAVNTISGLGSVDDQVDTIVIWRDADGGGASNMFELTEIVAPKPIAGVAQPWSFKDFLPDTPTSTFPGLDNLIPAPIDDQNDPPLVGFLPMAYHFDRIWGAIGQFVRFSGGPDVITGNPNEAFNPADEFQFLSTLVALVPTATALVTFLTTDIQQIAGGPATISFFQAPLAPGIGLQSFNAWDIYGGELYFISADSQAMIMSPSLQVAQSGFPIGDKLAAWDPSKVYVAVYQSGTDNCIIVADGSTGWYRLNPHQVPQNEQIWSPKADIVNGAKLVQKVETSKGIRKLLVGSTLPNQPLLQRDLTVFTDNGNAYDAWFLMGSIILTHPGELAVLGFIESDFTKVGSQPKVGYLLNEVYGDFSFFTEHQNDPPSIYGDNFVPQSIYPNRYYFAQTGQLARCRHMQLRVDFGKDTVQNEMLNLTIFGRLMVEL